MSYAPATSAALPRLTNGITPARLVRELLGRSLDELAAVGRDALLPVLPAPPLLATGALLRAARAQALSSRRKQAGRRR